MRRLPVAALLAVLLSGAAATAAPGDLEAIRDHVDRTMYRTALGELTAYLEEDGDSAAAWALLARYRLETEDIPGASKAAMRALELDGEEPAHWLMCGRIAMLVGQAAFEAGKPRSEGIAWFAHAESRFRKLQELVPKDPDVLWRIGQSREWQGYAGAARQFYELQIERFPDRPGGYLRLGEMLLNEAGRAEDPASAEARRLREEAHATFDAGLEKAGDDAELLYRYGVALEKAGAPDRALEHYLRSVRADPEYTRSWNRAAKLADPAEVLCPVAIEILRRRPTASDAAWWAGYYTNRRDPRRGEKPWARHAEALTYLLPALEVHGDHEGLYAQAFLAAQALYGKNPRRAPDARTGTDAFKRIHAAYRWSGDAANNLGFFYREAKKYDRSLAWYLKSVERAPENQDILNDTGLIYLFHIPRRRAKGLSYFLKTVALVREGDQKPERGYWDALENLCKHYWEVDRQPEKVVEYARMRYVRTKGVRPYNMSRKAAKHAELARKALAK